MPRHQITTEKDVANGYAGIDPDGKLPLLTKNVVYETENHVPSGFINHATSSLSLVENVSSVNDTFEFTITGTNFPVYVNGARYIKNTESIRQVGALSKRYFIYYNANGVLTISDTSWSLESENYDGSAPIATVAWNATTHKGVLEEERHHSWRDVKWHHWAHHTVGARYAYAHANYLNLSKPTTSGVDYQSIDIASGQIYDEDIELVIGNQTTCRVFYGDSTAMYWEDAPSTFPYKTSATATTGGATDNPYYYDKTLHQLIQITGNNNNGHFVSWVYATNAYDDPKIAVVIDQRTTGSTMTIAQARSVSQPAFPTDYVLEWKLLYKLIYLRSAAGTTAFIESADYRNSSSLPSGQTASLAASDISFVPTGDVSATNVQSAIVELDTEKSPIASPTFTGNVTVPSTIATVSLITATSGGVAIPLTTLVCEVTTDGDSDLDNATLANGTVGQIMLVVCKTVGNVADSLKITPATSLSGTSISLGVNPKGRGAIFEYTASGWVCLGTYGAKIPTITAVTTGSVARTMSAAQIVAGNIQELTGTTSRAFTFDTGTNISAAYTALYGSTPVGSSVSFVVKSSGTSSGTITFAAAPAGVTITAQATIAIGTSRLITLVNTGTNTWTVY